MSNNCEIAHEYGISESMEKMMQPATSPVSGELRMTAKCASMERYQPKDLSWISCYREGVVKHANFRLFAFL